MKKNTKLILASFLATAIATATVQAASLPTCEMIATGGTIAMKIDPIKKAPVPAISGEDLLETVPEVGEVANIQVQNLSNVPSDYMDPERWVELTKAVSKSLEEANISGVIISHGTDTLEETAYFLDLTVESKKPVVLIGAQRNASEKDFDGPRNLLNAARVCVNDESVGKGVLLVMNNQINAAREVTKTHTSDVETFKSGDYGFLGNVDMDRIVFYRAPLRQQHIALLDKPLAKVEIVAMFGGADGSQVDAAVANGAEGIVIQALGWGNVNIPMYESIKKAIDQGVAVAISTRVPNGRVLPNYGFQGGGKTLQDLGALFADDLSPQKARILLMLALQHTSDHDKLQSYFDI